VLAGDDVYELFFTHSTTGLKSYISEHYVHDWNTIPNIDMEKPYWDQSARECMSVDGILPLASSKLIIPDINSLLYNKEMYEDYSLEPPHPYRRTDHIVPFIQICTHCGWSYDDIAYAIGGCGMTCRLPYYYDYYD